MELGCSGRTVGDREATTPPPKARPRGGATEARTRRAPTSPEQALFGENALATALAGCAGLDAAGIVHGLGEALAEHSGSWAGDDTALLALRLPPRH